MKKIQILLLVVLAASLVACKEKKLVIEMVKIPAGTFTMGSPAAETGRDNRELQRQVTLTQGFHMSKYQITQGQYMAVMGGNSSHFHGGSDRKPMEGEIQDSRPVEMVSWYDAIVFCNKLSIMEKRTPAYEMQTEADPNVWSTDPNTWGIEPASNNERWNAVRIVDGSTGYRLPTEAQWEYACRAETTTAYNTGNTIDDDIGWYNANNNNGTRQVGLKPANAWGLHDMHGNVWEWCWDWHGAYTSGEQTDPMGVSTGSCRVRRGGSWFNSASDLRSAIRDWYDPSSWNYGIGFRVIYP